MNNTEPVTPNVEARKDILTSRLKSSNHLVTGNEDITIIAFSFAIID